MHLEANLFSARRLVTDIDLIHLSPILQVLRLVVLIDGELGIAIDDSEVGVSSLGIEGQGEGEERGS